MRNRWQLWAPTVNVGRPERWRAAIGSGLGILLTATISHALGAPALIAPMGASAVLLFALPASPLAQPWNVLMGNLVSAGVGVACAALLGHLHPAAAPAAAMAGALLAMFILRCLHPPGGAIALTAALQGAGPAFVLTPVGLESLLLLAVAVAYNNATRHPYPHPPSVPAPVHGTQDRPSRERLGFTRADLDAVLRQQDQVMDVNPDDLATLLHRTEQRAFERLHGQVRCEDIMSKDVLTLDFATPLQEAWDSLHKHRIHALPVLDRGRRVAGIVTVLDFVKHAGLDDPVTLAARLRALLRPSGLSHGAHPEVVGQIMSRPVRTVPSTMHIAELVPWLSDGNFHHLPVVDERERLVGMVTQSDLVAALYALRAKGFAGQS